jgi:hypothetical protein
MTVDHNAEVGSKAEPMTDFKNTTYRYTGRIDQLLGATSLEFTDGPERGSRGYHLHNDTGLELTVLGDRALDIGPARFQGKALAWLSPAGFAAPGLSVDEGKGWLRTFGSGLVTTCGLTNVGTSVGGEYPTGQHGRISSTPASHVVYGTRLVDGQYEAFVEGQVREACIFRENFLMERSVRVRQGEGNIYVDTRVTNEGARTFPLLLLLHCNFGWPLLSEHTRLSGPFEAVTPRDADAAAGSAEFGGFSAPVPGYREQVFFPSIHDGIDRPTVVLDNPSIGLRAKLQYNQSEMPHLSIWKMIGVQEYVCGIEPGTCHPVGRDEAARRGQLITLEPGESRQFNITISVDQAEPGP